MNFFQVIQRTDNRDGFLYGIYECNENQPSAFLQKAKPVYSFRQGYNHHHHHHHNHRHHHHHHHHNPQGVQNVVPVSRPLAYWFSASNWQIISSGISRLNKEMECVYKGMRPNSEDLQVRRTLIERIDEVIKSKWNTAKVEVFGSFKTNLYLRTSDIDLVVVDSSWRRPPFYELKDELIAQNICDQHTVIVLDNASVPIIKLTDKQSSIKVDIGFNIANAQESAKLIQECISEFPSLPCVVMILKQFLVERDLNEVYTGGISSYSLILMVISYLKYMSCHVQMDFSNCGEVLLNFLHFYGVLFDYCRYAISIKNHEGFVPRNTNLNVLSIRDPLYPSNDVARGSYRFDCVREAFSGAYQRLLIRLGGMNTASKDVSILSEIIKIPCFRHHSRQGKACFNESCLGVSSSTGSISSASSDTGFGSFADTDSDSEATVKAMPSKNVVQSASQKLYADVVKMASSSGPASPSPSLLSDHLQEAFQSGSTADVAENRVVCDHSSEDEDKKKVEADASSVFASATSPSLKILAIQEGVAYDLPNVSCSCNGSEPAATTYSKLKQSMLTVPLTMQ